MADTGTNITAGFDAPDVDLEMATLIGDVVRKRALPGNSFGENAAETDAARTEIDGLINDVRRDVEAQTEFDRLMDEVKRDVETRSARPDETIGASGDTDATPLDNKAALNGPSSDNAPRNGYGKPVAWLADAVIARQTMEKHEKRGRGQFGEYTRSADVQAEARGRTERKRSFRSNPFVGAIGRSSGAEKTVRAEVTKPAPVRTEPQSVTKDSQVEAAPAEAQIARDIIAQNWSAKADSSQDLKPDMAQETRTSDLANDDKRHGLSETAQVDPVRMPNSIATEQEDAHVPEAATLVAAQEAVRADGDGSDGPPVWLALGIPVAAVSMVALVAGVNGLQNSQPASGNDEAFALAPLTVSQVEQVADVSIPVTDAAIAAPTEIEAVIADAPAIEVAATGMAGAALSSSASSVDAADDAITSPASLEGAARLGDVEETLLTNAPAPSPQIEALMVEDIAPAASEAPIVDISHPVQSVPVAGPSLAAPLSETLPVPSMPTVKPQQIAQAASGASVTPRPSVVRKAIARPAVFGPQQSGVQGQIPVRVFDGEFAPGSAALLVNNAVSGARGPLSRAERNWLARDMERALDNELDGRQVSLKSAKGDRVGLRFARSSQVLRHLPVRRDRGVAPLPAQMVLEGGWYVARESTKLRATPSLAGTFSNRTIEKGTLIERMGTITDRFGDRWYLMGQNGVAVGYMSPADLVIAEASTEPAGLPYYRAIGAVVREQVPVYTRCRTVFVGPFGTIGEQMDVCRNASGNWVASSDGLASVQQAEAGQAEPIVLASAALDSPDLLPFEAPSVRKALAPKLVYAREGQDVKQVLADGRDVALTLGTKYKSAQMVQVQRLETLGRIDRPMQLDARWMRVPAGAPLRATPDHFTPLEMDPVAPGVAIEMIGTVTDERGEDWALIGRDGIGFGYVLRDELKPLAGSQSLRAFPRAHTSAVVDLVEAEVDCRSVAYSADEMDGNFTACQRSNGQWALSGPAALRQLVELEPFSQVAP